MNFIDDKLMQYAEEHSTPESPLLQQLNRNTYAKVMQPRMLSGHLQGRFLSMMSTMIAPTYILELGTYTGYSALSLAEGLTPNGILHTIEIDEELEHFAKKYFDQSPLGKKIITHVGDIKNVIPALNITFDLIFIDADKSEYPYYYDMCKQVLRPGGYIIADNVLWSGNVIKDKAEQDQDTSHIISFNNKVMNDIEVENVLLPIRDGLMIIRKL